MLKAAGAVRAHHDQVSRQTGGAFEDVARRLTTLDEDVQIDAGCRRRLALSRDAGAERFQVGVALRFALARQVDSGN